MIGVSPAIFAASLIAVAAAASPPQAVVDRAAPLALFQARGSSLHARQYLQYPDSCDSLCLSISQTVAACVNLDCVCTTENENAFVNCLDCAVAAISTSANIEIAQEALNSYREGCATDGFALGSPTTLNPSLTLNSATSTTSTTNTSTGTTSTTSTSTGTSTSTTTTSSTTPATTSQSKSGAIGVGDRAEVLSMLFSLCLMAVLLV